MTNFDGNLYCEYTSVVEENLTFKAFKNEVSYKTAKGNK
jgi:hypothetical protein